MLNNYNYEHFQIRKATEKDWPVIYSLYEMQGWHKRNLFISELDYCAVMVAVDSNDVPVSTVSYAIHRGYVNLNAYLTHPDFRGSGIGSMLWKYVMEQLIGIDKNFYLRAEDKMTGKYKSTGFTLISTMPVLRYLGFFNVDELEKFSKNLENFGKIVTDDFLNNNSIIDEIVTYDNNIHEEDNSKFLKIWLKHSQDINSDMYTVYAKNDAGHVIGYGTVLLCPNSFKIGPLFADNFEIFFHILKRLIDHKFSNHNNQLKYELAVPSTNCKVIDFLTKVGLKHTTTLKRSFTKSVKDLSSYDKVFCFTRHVGVPE